MDRSHGWNGQETIAKSKHFYVHGGLSNHWVNKIQESESVSRVYLKSLMKRKLKSVRRTGKRNNSHKYNNLNARVWNIGLPVLLNIVFVLFSEVAIFDLWLA